MNETPRQSLPDVALAAILRPGPVAGLAATNMAVQATALVAGVIAARVLGVAGRGDLAAVILWPMLAGNVATLGVDAALGVQVGRDHSALGRLIRVGVLHALLVGPVFMLVGLVLARVSLPVGRDDLRALSAAFLWIVPLHLLWLDFLALDNGQQRYVRYNLTRFAFFALYALGYAGCWLLDAVRIEYFIYAQTGAMLGTVAVRLIQSGPMVWKGGPVGTMLRRTVGMAKGFALSNAAIMLLVRIDVILVMVLLGTRALGLYVVAQAVANVPSLLSQAFAVRTFGSSVGASDEAAFVRTVVVRFRQSFVLSGVFALALALVAPLIIRVLFGAPFEEAATVARVLFFASWLFNGGRIIDEGFRGRGRPIFGTIAFGCQIVCVCLVGFLLGSRLGWGATGVAISVLMGSALALSILVVMFRSQTGRWVFAAERGEKPGREANAR